MRLCQKGERDGFRIPVDIEGEKKKKKKLLKELKYGANKMQ